MDPIAQAGPVDLHQGVGGVLADGMNGGAVAQHAADQPVEFVGIVEADLRMGERYQVMHRGDRGSPFQQQGIGQGVVQQGEGAIPCGACLGQLQGGEAPVEGETLAGGEEQSLTRQTVRLVARAGQSLQGGAPQGVVGRDPHRLQARRA